jgi:hypothetical protein
LALYLFLVTVADAQGLSYYSDSSLGKYLTMHSQTVRKARRELSIAGLIAYQEPLYQVLDLDELPTGAPSRLASASNHSRTLGKTSNDDDDDDDDQPPMSPAPLKSPTPTTPPTLWENNFSRSKKITPISEIINSIMEGNSR